MSSQQPGAPAASEQPGASSDQAPQMEASQPRKAPRAPGLAAFGTSSGAAVIFRDYASI